jgi:hypothetical protein
MALRQSDILVHNNPNLAVVDGDFVKGGFRTAVASVNDLYTLSGKTDEPSAAGQLKEHATFVYVTGETKYYELIDINNVGNASGWQPFVLGGDGVTGATNGLTKVGNDVVLGGTLTGDTCIKVDCGSLYLIDTVDNYTSIGKTNMDSYYFDGQIDGGFSVCAGCLSLNVSDTINNISNSINIDTDSNQIKLSSINCSCNTMFMMNWSAMTINSEYDGFSGIQYADDYSANYVSRSLVDKEYVDNRVISLTGVTSQAITGATNGLTKVGNDAVLGGSLDDTVSICSNEFDIEWKSCEPVTGTFGYYCFSSNYQEMDTSYICDSSTIYDAYIGVNANSISARAWMNVNENSIEVDDDKVSIRGLFTLETSPNIGSLDDKILVLSSDYFVKYISQSSLGDKNNIYSFSAVTSNTTLTTGSTYVILANPSAEITIILPAIPFKGQVFKIKDISGLALTYNVIISGNGMNIDGNATAVINTNYGALELMYNGTSWFGLSFFN